MMTMTDVIASLPVPTPEDRTCGACGGLFDTVNAVFSHDCPAISGRAYERPATRPTDNVDHRPESGIGSGAGSFRPASEASVRLLSALARAGFVAKGSPDVEALVVSYVERVAAGGQRSVSAAIDKGKAAGYQPMWQAAQAQPSASAPVPLPDVPAGHYAIVSTGDNDLAFYRIDRPTDGPHADRVFVKLIVGGHPDSNVRRDHVAGILARIAADPDAGARYGREIGRCGRCNRHLTDETSRERGYGPECWGRM